AVVERPRVLGLSWTFRTFGRLHAHGRHLFYGADAPRLAALDIHGRRTSNNARHSRVDAASSPRPVGPRPPCDSMRRYARPSTGSTVDNGHPHLARPARSRPPVLQRTSDLNAVAARGPASANAKTSRSCTSVCLLPRFAGLAGGGVAERARADDQGQDAVERGGVRLCGDAPHEAARV